MTKWRRRRRDMYQCEVRNDRGTRKESTPPREQPAVPHQHQRAAHRHHRQHRSNYAAAAATTGLAETANIAGSLRASHTAPGAAVFHDTTEK